MQASTKGLEWDGEAYHRLSDMQYTAGVQFLDSLSLQGHETIIDAGCGSGRITVDLLARLPEGKVIGVDLGESMLHTAREVVQPKPGQQAEFIQANLQTFIADAPVDGIYSNMCLHFVHDHGKLFQNMAQSLKPNGWLALQFGSSRQAHLIRPWFDLMQKGKYAPYLHSLAFDFKGADVPDTEENLRNAGFVDIDVQAVELEQVPEFRDKMHEYFTTVMLKDCLERLPEEMHAEFQSTLGEMFSAAFDQPFTFIRVRARMPEAH